MKPETIHSKAKKNSCLHFFMNLGAAVFLASFIVFGKAFYETNSWKPIFGSKSGLLFAFIQELYWSILFFAGICLLLHWWDSPHLFTDTGEGKIPHCLKMPAAPLKKYYILLRKNPFLVAFFTFLAGNLPYLILSFPAIFMGDSATQIAQFIGASLHLTNDHPVFHTLLLSLFINTGKRTGQWNPEIFLYCIVQTLFLISVMAYAIEHLIRIRTNPWIVGTVLLYFCIHPRIFSYFCLVTKDVIYAGFFTLFYVSLFDLMQEDSADKKTALIFGTSILGMMLSRNESICIILASLLASLFWKKMRKKAARLLCMTGIVSLTLNFCIYPLLHIGAGSIGEILSVPFQQTARVVKYAEDDLSDEEISSIDRVLDYNSLADRYNPNLSDPVKASFHGSAEDLTDFFATWFHLFRRHPGICLQATMNNYYQYFYPQNIRFNCYTYSWSEKMMKGINNSFGLDYHYPESLTVFRNNFEMIREEFFTLPPISLLNTPAFYTWTTILFVLCCIHKKSRPGFIYSVPMIVHLLVMISGPTNGAYGRYQYPMLLYLPFTLIFGLKLIRTPR